MKLSHIILSTLLIFTLFSCRESWVKTNERIPAENNQDSIRKVKDTTHRFKDNYKENTPKSKRDLDTLKPRIASDLRLRQKLLEHNKS